MVIILHKNCWKFYFVTVEYNAWRMHENALDFFCWIHTLFKLFTLYDMHENKIDNNKFAIRILKYLPFARVFIVLEILTARNNITIGNECWDPPPLQFQFASDTYIIWINKCSKLWWLSMIEWWCTGEKTSFPN